jgi:hypothetical protein
LLRLQTSGYTFLKYTYPSILPSGLLLVPHDRRGQYWVSWSMIHEHVSLVAIYICYNISNALDYGEKQNKFCWGFFLLLIFKLSSRGMPLIQAPACWRLFLFKIKRKKDICKLMIISFKYMNCNQIDKLCGLVIIVRILK